MNSAEQTIDRILTTTATDNVWEQPNRVNVSPADGTCESDWFTIEPEGQTRDGRLIW